MNRIVALYLRLSKADKRANGAEGELLESDSSAGCCTVAAQVSLSIKNQQALLERFVRQDEELSHYGVEIFTDDGFSGLEDNRPALQKMLSRVMGGEVCAVLVKDFSRLSRNHLYLASLREQVFPAHYTELIALGDGYDSRSDGGNMLALRFKSLFYEYYSRDISRKVKASLMAKKEKGEYAVAKPPYGYRVENGCWRIERAEAAVIRRIFELAAEGHAGSEIVSLLEEEAHPAKLYLVKVMRILGNPVYCGKHVWHKYENHIGFYKKSVALPREQWRVEEGNHPPIISEELFVRAGESVQGNRRKELI